MRLCTVRIDREYAGYRGTVVVGDPDDGDAYDFEAATLRGVVREVVSWMEAVDLEDPEDKMRVRGDKRSRFRMRGWD